MDVPAYKIASFEVVDLPLIRRIAQSGKPVIMSTGMASLGEIEEAVETIRAAGNNRLALLKCTSAYPAPPEEMNLLTIPHLSEAFNAPVGLSDHTLGIAVPWPWARPLWKNILRFLAMLPVPTALSHWNRMNSKKW
jgi:N-acetylneuraminate synthase